MGRRFNPDSWLQPSSRLWRDYGLAGLGKSKLNPWKLRENLENFRKSSSIADYPHNTLRHSFASYHLAPWGDVMKTALKFSELRAGATEEGTPLKPPETPMYCTRPSPQHHGFVVGENGPRITLPSNRCRQDDEALYLDS